MKYWEALLVAAVMFKIVFVSFYGKVVGFVTLHIKLIELKAVIEAYLSKTQTSFYFFFNKRCNAKLLGSWLIFEDSYTWNKMTTHFALNIFKTFRQVKLKLECFQVNL